MPGDEEQSEDENLLDVARPVGALKKQNGERLLDIPVSAGDSEHPISGRGNRFLHLTPEIMKAQEEHVWNHGGTMAGGAQEKVQSRPGSFAKVQGNDISAAGTMTTVQRGKQKENIQHQAGKIASTSPNIPVFPGPADIPNLPDHAGHTPRPARFTKMSPHFGQFYQQNAGPISSLVAPTNFGLPQKSTPGNHQSIYPHEADRSGGDTVTNTNPSTARPQSSHRSTMSESDMPSTSNGSPLPRSSLASSTRPIDLHAAPGDSVLHPLTRVTKEMKARATDYAVTAPKGRPSDATKALLRSANLGSTSGISDPFRPYQPPQQAIPRAASAGPSQPIQRPLLVPAFPALPAGVGLRQVIDPNNPHNQFFVICHFRLQVSDALLGTGVVVVSPNHVGEPTWPTLVTEINAQLTQAKNWFGMRDIARRFTQTIPATAKAPAIEQNLELQRVVVRFDHGLGMGEEAEEYDMSISDTPELIRAFRAMARRSWKDILVAYFSLGPRAPMTEGKGKGKRVRRREDDDQRSERGDKRSRTDRSPSVQTMED